MRINRFGKSIGLVVGALSLSTAAVGVAGSAAWASVTIPTPIRVPLTQVGVTRVATVTDGMSQIYFANGTSAIVPSTVASGVRITGGGITPQNTVYGSCGYSYIYVDPNSNNSGVSGFTGWDVYSSVIGQAYYFEWGSEIENTSFLRYTNFEWDDPINTNSWTTFFSVLDGAGSYSAFVVGGTPGSLNGYVFGTNGVCTSIGSRSYTVVP
ncbi:MAG: hypothetical protein HKL82_04075 [Acidimicrobiaceae bacterium]|nr:hypothetical protein [Acidimicrobiaceae bacterium]